MFVTAFIFPILYHLVWIIFIGLLTFLLLDILILFYFKDGIQASRITPEKLSNGDENDIVINIKNKYSFTVLLKIIDEIPFQFHANLHVRADDLLINDRGAHELHRDGSNLEHRCFLLRLGRPCSLRKDRCPAHGQ